MKTLQLIVIFTLCNILQSYAQYTTVVLPNELEIIDKELIKRIDPQLLRQIFEDNQALEVICDEIKSKDRRCVRPVCPECGGTNGLLRPDRREYCEKVKGYAVKTGG